MIDRLAARLITVLALPLLVTTAHAQAEDPVRPGPVASPYGLQIQAGLEPHLVMSVRYVGRAAGAPTGASGFGIGAGVRFSPYLVGRGSARLSLIATGQWLPDSGPGVVAATEAYFVRGRNRAGTAHGLGVEIRAAPGYHRSRRSLALDLGWQGTLLLHIRHSDAARETFEERYPDDTGGESGPRDGWYGSTAHRFRMGLVGEHRIGNGVALRVAAGGLFSIQDQGILLGFAHGQVPVYLETSVRSARSQQP